MNIIFDRYGVITVQKMLNKLGGYGLDEDGIYGRNTQAALDDFGDYSLEDILLERLANNDTLDYINVAKGEIGTKEWHGEADNPEVMKYHHSVATWFKDDETPWCASFVNWVMEEAGYDSMDSARALDWLNHGEESEPVFGAIAVKARYNSEGKAVGGHVGFLVGEDRHYFYILGGNQKDSVRISKYKKDTWKGFRVPIGYEDKYLLTVPNMAEDFSEGGKES